MSFFDISNFIRTSTIIASARGDVTGDKIPDNVYLTGQKQLDSPYIKDISLTVRDGRNGKITSVPLTQNQGYNPTLFLGDFTSNGVNQILVRIDSGGSGAFTFDYVFSFLKNVPQILFDSDVYNEKYKYKINYLNFYRVEVVSLFNSKKYIIDISYKGLEYLNEIYDFNGVLKQPIEGFINPLSSLLPVDIEINNIYDLLAFQKIAGRYNADSLGYIQNFLKWNGKEFELFNQYLAVFGAD